jgi:hypothetical protein
MTDHALNWRPVEEAQTVRAMRGPKKRNCVDM